MTDFRLANVLLRLPEHLRCYPELLYRASGAVDLKEEDSSLAFEGSLDLLTYFNAFSAAKWRTYADIKNVTLHLELIGDACDIILTGVASADLDPKDAPGVTEACTTSAVKLEVRAKRLAAASHFEGSAEYQSMDIEVPLDGMTIVGCTLESHGATAIKNSYWTAEVPDERIRDIRIAIATTTFKNEDYILPNIEMVRREVLEAGERASDRIHLYVIDNGKTLDVEALSGNGVTIVPNANEGGAAGFARGMMEALASEEGFTHVILMDDDVRMSPESFIRTFNLLSLATDEYKDAFINGAMLEMEHPNKQFEDVSHVLPSGIYQRLKGNLFLDTLADVAMNEVIDVEVPDAYGAWWYSCIPLAVVRESGLPLPLFVRCDDVEFGMRAKPTYMTMNGICVWHAAFTHKFRASVDCYQYIRNYLLMNAIHGISSEPLFIARVSRTLQLYLRSMAYEAAELMVQGFEDYLRGPEWLAAARGEDIFKANNAKQERMVPLEEALMQAVEEHPELASELNSFEPEPDLVSENRSASIPLKLIRSIPYDKHLLPDALLRDEPTTAYYGGFTSFSPHQTATRVLVACDRECETAHVRFMDRERWRAIRHRWARACADHRARGAQVAEAYRQAVPELTSVSYWKEHLGLRD